MSNNEGKEEVDFVIRQSTIDIQSMMISQKNHQNTIKTYSYLQKRKLSNLVPIHAIDKSAPAGFIPEKN